MPSDEAPDYLTNTMLSDPQNVFQYLSQTYLNSLSDPFAAISASAATKTFVGGNVWYEFHAESTLFALANQNFAFRVGTLAGGGASLYVDSIQYQTTNYGDPAPTATDQPADGQSYATYYTPDQGGGGLEIDNFAQGEFGLTLKNGAAADYSNVYANEFQVLKGWKTGSIRPAPLAPGYSITFGSAPLQLGT